MYLCLMLPFLKNPQIKNAICNFMLAFNLFGGFIVFFEPSGLCHPYWTLTLHAFIWHLLLVFIGLYIGFSRQGGNKRSDYKGAVCVFLILCALAFTINLLLYKISDHSVNMFYIGPADSPLIVFKDICKNYGWYVNTPIYIFSLCLGAYLFFLPFAKYNETHR